jgi:hypothetical protein
MIYQKDIGMDVRNVVSLILMRPLSIYFFLSRLLVLYGILCMTYNIPPSTDITNMFGNWLNRIDKRPRLGFA